MLMGGLVLSTGMALAQTTVTGKVVCARAIPVERTSPPINMVSLFVIISLSKN